MDFISYIIFGLAINMNSSIFAEYRYNEIQLVFMIWYFRSLSCFWTLLIFNILCLSKTGMFQKSVIYFISIDFIITQNILCG